MADLRQFVKYRGWVMVRPRQTVLRPHGWCAALVGSAMLIAAPAANAQDATWLATPGSGDFNTAANWTPAAVPPRTGAVVTAAAPPPPVSRCPRHVGGSFHD